MSALRCLQASLCFALSIVTAAAQAEPSERSPVNIDIGERQPSERVNLPAAAGPQRPLFIKQQTRLLGEIRKAIGTMHRLAGDFRDQPAELYKVQKELVDLNFEAASYYVNLDFERYERRWDEWHRRGGEGPEPRLDSKTSLAAWDRVVDASRAFLRDFPRAPDSAKVLMSMAVAQDYLGQADASARSLSRLIRDYPNAEEVPGAQFQLGQYYFDRADFQQAIVHLKQTSRRAEVYPYALHRLGWCYYNLGRYEQALAYWQQTVRLASR